MLKEEREKAGLTQLQLANLAGVDPITISRWERGKTRPDLATMLAVAHVLSVPLDSVLPAAVAQ